MRESGNNFDGGGATVSFLIEKLRSEMDGWMDG